MATLPPEHARLPKFTPSEPVLNQGERIRLSDPCLRGGLLFHTWMGPTIWAYRWSDGKPVSPRTQVIAETDEWGFDTGIDTFNCVRLHDGRWLGFYQAQWCIGTAVTEHQNEELTVNDEWVLLGPAIAQATGWMRQLEHPQRKAISPGVWEPAPFRLGQNVGVIFAARGPWSSGLEGDRDGTCDRLGYAQTFPGWGFGRSFLTWPDPFYVPPGREENRDGLNAVSHPEVLPDKDSDGGLHMFCAAGGHGRMVDKGIWHAYVTDPRRPDGVWWNPRNPIVPLPDVEDFTWHIGGPTARYLDDGRIELLMHGQAAGEQRHLRVSRQPL